MHSFLSCERQTFLLAHRRWRDDERGETFAVRWLILFRHVFLIENSLNPSFVACEYRSLSIVASHIRDISQTITSGEEKRDGRFRRSFGVQYKFHWIFVLVIYAIEFDWIINCEYPTVVLLNQSKYLLWFLVEKLWTTIRILCTRLTFLKPFEHIYSFKTGFHYRRSRSRSRKRSHKCDGIGVGRIRTFPFSSDSAYDSIAYDNPIIMHVLTLCDLFSSSASACDSGNLVFTWS